MFDSLTIPWKTCVAAGSPGEGDTKPSDIDSPS